MRAPFRTRIVPALLLLCGLATTWAQQLKEDSLQLKASETLLTDSNIYRLPANTNFDALIGRPNAADRIGVTSVGLSYNKSYSLQRVELDLSLVDYKYQNFNKLNFTARNYDAAWRWALTPRLRGDLTSNRKETLNSFTDFLGANFANRSNQRVEKNTNFNTDYELSGAWHLLAGVAQRKYLTRSTLTAVDTLYIGDDYTSTSTRAGLRYDFSSGSALTYRLQNTQGQNLNANGLIISNQFTQTDNELRLSWVLSGKSTVDLSSAFINRHHDQFAQRDYSGVNAGVNLKWNMTGKSALTAGWTRNLTSAQSVNSNYVQSDRLSIGPVWQLSPKTMVRLSYAQTRDNYLGAPGLVQLPQRSDNTTSTTLALDWQPNRGLTLSTSLQSARRNSNLDVYDFTSNMATISGQLSY
jgi:exopolysaccharide biosynthesis operon protein EpsL